MSGHIKSGIHGGIYRNKCLSCARVELSLLSLQKVASSRFGKDIRRLILLDECKRTEVLLNFGFSSQCMVHLMVEVEELMISPSLFEIFLSLRQVNQEIFCLCLIVFEHMEIDMDQFLQIDLIVSLVVLVALQCFDDDYEFSFLEKNSF